MAVDPVTATDISNYTFFETENPAYSIAVIDAEIWPEWHDDVAGSNVLIDLYDIRGRRVRRLWDDTALNGCVHEMRWRGSPCFAFRPYLRHNGPSQE